MTDRQALEKIAKLNKSGLVDGDLWDAINEVLKKVGLGYDD